MKISLIICMMVFMGFGFAYTQSLSSTLISSGGGYGTGNSTNLSWSLGETVVFNAATLTQGFHQPRVRCDNVDTTSLVIQGSETCQGTNGIITVFAAEKGLNYQAFSSGVEVGAKGTGTADDLILILPFQELFIGNNIMNVQVTKMGCDPKILSDTTIVSKVMSTGKMPPIQASGSAVCIPPSLYLFARQGLNKYQWILNDTLIAGANTSINAPQVPGNYQVIGFVDKGCLSASDTFKIYASDFASPPPPPVNKAGGNLVCELSPVTLSTPTLGLSSYQWRRDFVQIAGATDATYQVIIPGNYTVDVRDSKGCSNLSSVVKIDLQPEVVIPQLIAGGDPFMLTCSVSNPNYHYQWYASWDATKRAIVNAKDTVAFAPYYSATYYVLVKYDTCKVMSSPYIVNKEGMLALSRMVKFVSDTSVYIPELNKYEISIYPNPAKNAFHLLYTDVDHPVKFRFYNSIGISQSIVHIKNGAEYIFQTTDLTPGIYLLCIDNDKGTQKQAVVIE